MNDIIAIIEQFGRECNNCDLEGGPIPKLAIVCDSDRIEKAKEYNSSVKVNFEVTIITGSEYCEKAFPGIKDDCFTDKYGIDTLVNAGCAAYNADDRTVYVLYPYPANSDFPLERSLIHEIGHYKQDIICNARRTGNPTDNIILEYHNIMINENLSSKTISGCGTCKDKRISYDMRIDYSKSYNEIKITELKPILENQLSKMISEYSVNKNLLEEMLKALKSSIGDNAEINTRLIINLLRSIKCQIPKI